MLRQASSGGDITPIRQSCFEEFRVSDLSGNLGQFGLRRVLGFLAGAGVTGELRVQFEDGDGRVLFQDGSIGYATTATSEDTVQELDSLLARYQAGGLGASSLDGGETPASMEDVLREQLTEVLYHLTLVESGSFNYTRSPDRPGFDAVDSFSVDDLLRLVDIRIEEWRQIREVVPSNETFYQLVSDIPDGRGELTLSAPRWRLLAAVGGGASVTDVAVALDLPEFHAAGKVADLVEDGLLEPAGEAARALESETTRASDDETESEAVGDDNTEPPTEWNSDLEAVIGPEMPRAAPRTDPVTFSKQDLSREDMDEMIRNIGRGVFPS